MEKVIFDYQSLGKELLVQEEVLAKLEQEALNEFPSDNMLREIHIMRALKAYVRSTERMIAVEN